VSGGLEYAQERGSATVNGYYTELFDEIAYIDTGLVEREMTVYDTGNISRSLRIGIDTEGKVSFLTYGYASAGYSYVFAWDRSAGEELRPQPAHTVKFRLGLDTAKGAASGDGASSPGTATKKITLAAWAGGRLFSAIKTTQNSGEARLVLDAYVAASFVPHFKVYLSVDNLLGTIDRFFGPAAPQIFSLGLNYTL
jgi:outer membrane receptor for ferrienterochelin and colicins